MKNKILFYAAAAVTGLTLVGCMDDFLVKSPTGKESEPEFYKTMDQNERALSAAYDILGYGAVTETHEWFIGDIASDDALKGGESPVDQGDVQALRYFRDASNNSVLAQRWQALYQGINRANLVIDNVNRVEDADTMKASFVAQVTAEAKFLRAYYYFSLMTTFGPVPLVLHVPGADQYCTARDSKAAVWAQIEKDLSEAAAVLPLKKDYQASDLGRATKGAAQSYLVKAYIYQQKWAEAAALADTVISSNQYKLLPDFRTNFLLAGENGDESIFEVQHTHVASDAWGDDNEGEVTSIFQGNRLAKYENGWGFDDPTQDLVDEFEDGDPRARSTYYTTGDTLWNGEVQDCSQSWTNFHSRKYLVEFQGTPLPWEMSNDPNNWRAFRYADLLLFAAEADIQTGDIAKGVGHLNEVRTRAKHSTIPPGVANYTAPDTTKPGFMPLVSTGLAKDAALAAVYHERRVELALEGHRFFDVVRRGEGPTKFSTTDPPGTIGGATRTFVAGKNEVFPIPSSEIALCPKLTPMPPAQ